MDSVRRKLEFENHLKRRLPWWKRRKMEKEKEFQRKPRKMEEKFRRKRRKAKEELEREMARKKEEYMFMRAKREIEEKFAADLKKTEDEFVKKKKLMLQTLARKRVKFCRNLEDLEWTKSHKRHLLEVDFKRDAEYYSKLTEKVKSMREKVEKIASPA